ncbi:hypothetical protein AB833_14335 [Chromatiales bacterium (ex Bugula neritina AB1)]|nr:hypothetical protein AB833_14335 [Chromatiales bacterium (ex Bugula neritina AB1)]
MKKLALAGLMLVGLAACEGGDDARELGNRVLVASSGFTAVAVNSDATVMEANSQLQLALLAGTDGADLSNNVSSNAIWFSSDNTVATVSASGLVSGLTDGITTIIADFGPLGDSVDIRVSSAPLSQILVTTPEAAIDECTSASFTAMGVYAGEEEQRNITGIVDWSASTDPLVGVFDNTSTAGLFRSSNTGTATVTATRNGVPGTQSITVLNNLNLIDIAEPSFRLTPRRSVDFSATATFDDNDESVDITDNANWVISSDVVDYGRVDNTLPDKGLVTATRTGAGTLTVSCGGQTDSLPILSGSATVVVDFELSPDDNRIERPFVGGDELQLRSFVRFEDRTNDEVTEDTSWTVTASENSLITLSNERGSRGLITIQGRGRITVRATYIDESTNVAVPRTRSVEIIIN